MVKTQNSHCVHPFPDILSQVQVSSSRVNIPKEKNNERKNHCYDGANKSSYNITNNIRKFPFRLLKRDDRPV